MNPLEVLRGLAHIPALHERLTEIESKSATCAPTNGTGAIEGQATGQVNIEHLETAKTVLDYLGGVRQLVTKIGQSVDASVSTESKLGSLSADLLKLEQAVLSFDGTLQTIRAEIQGLRTDVKAAIASLPGQPVTQSEPDPAVIEARAKQMFEEQKDELVNQRLMEIVNDAAKNKEGKAA